MTFGNLVRSLFVGAVIVAVACSGTTIAAKGQLMLVITSDMSPPKDFDVLSVAISRGGVQLHSADYDIATGSAPQSLPATLGIVAGGSPTEPIDIRVVARQGGTSGRARVLRDVRTLIPYDRIAMLPISIQWLCDGQVTEHDGSLESTCGPGNTCIAGACRPVTDGTEAPADYDPTAVSRTCFDTLACFSTGSLVPVANKDGKCIIAKPAPGSGINVALAGAPGSSGVCSSRICLIPLEQNPVTGWTDIGTELLLPSAVCSSLDQLGVAVTTSCPTKSQAVGTCGPWATGGVGTADAAPPASGACDPSIAKCQVGQRCTKDEDCANNNCLNETCLAPSCGDGRINGNEAGVDCGPAPCKLCDGAACSLGPDCKSGVCNGTCGATPGKPCGVGAATACKVDDPCEQGGDCESKVCTNEKRCAAPSPTDNVMNNGETDIDCGGPNAPRCPTTRSCLVHTDCETLGCDDTQHCALGRSCITASGGRSCGASGSEESCCTSITLQSGAKLDKYLVTAGRMRAFIESVNGNVKQWFAASQESIAAPTQISPYQQFLPADLDTAPYGAKYQLGAMLYLPDRPSPNLQGCWVGTAAAPGYGTHTYDTGSFEGEQRSFNQAYLDALPLNCVPFPLLAAFCAWDGGRVQTEAEFNEAWGAATYPWGASPSAGGYDSGTLVGPATTSMATTACPSCDPLRANWRNSYFDNTAAVNSGDFAFYISRPGRFPLGNGALTPTLRGSSSNTPPRSMVPTRRRTTLARR